MKIFKQALSLLLLTLILFTHTVSASEQSKLETIPYTVFLGWTNSNRAANSLVALSFETQDFYSNVETAVIIEDAREDKSFSLVSDGVNIKMYRLYGEYIGQYDGESKGDDEITWDIPVFKVYETEEVQMTRFEN